MNKTPQSKPTHAETKLRMPQALMAELREQYAQSYAQHRLSFNGWLLHLIRAAPLKAHFFAAPSSNPKEPPMRELPE